MNAYGYSEQQSGRRMMGLAMSLGTLLLLLLGTSLWGQNARDAQTRMWTDVTGQFKVEAALVRVTQDQVTLRTAEGRDIAVPFDKLNADGIKYARNGFRFHYTPGSGFESMNELGQKYLDAIKKQDGGEILDMYIPWDVALSSMGADATEEQKNKARKGWEQEFKDEEDPQSPQGQRVPHFLNGEFQRRKAIQGFDLTAAQFVEVRHQGSLFGNGEVSRDQFANNPRIIFQLPKYPGRLFYIDMEDCAKVGSRWYVARFGNTQDMFGFCLPKSPQESAKTRITIERLMTPFENLQVEARDVGLRDYSGTWNSSLKREEDGTLVFNHRDAEGKRVYSPIRELPADVYVYSLGIKGKKGTTSSGIRDLLTVLREIPSLRRLTLDSIPDEPSVIVDAVESLPYDLEDISLMHFPSLSDADAARIFSRHRLVSGVWIYECPNVGSKTVQAILSEKHLQKLSLWFLPKVTFDDLIPSKNCVDLYDLYLYNLPLSSFDIQRLLGETTAQQIKLYKTTLTPADVRTLRVAPEMPWDWRLLNLDGAAFKGLSDAETEEITEAYYGTNGFSDAYRLFISR